MPKITIEIVTNYDPRIKSTLDSIRQQSFQDYEVIISTDDDRIRDIAEDFDVRIITCPASGTLFRRIAAHDKANGDNVLLLEASRFLDRDCLLELIDRKEDMIIIEETDLESTLIAKIQNWERREDIRNAKCFSPEFLVVEPRYFKRQVIDEAYKAAALMNPDTLKWIRWGDLDIIYYEAYRNWKRVGITSRPLIYHYPDKNVRELFLKYYTYGISSKLLKLTPYKGKFRMSYHARPYCGLKKTLAIYALTSLKAVAFIYGNVLPREPQKIVDDSVR